MAFEKNVLMIMYDLLHKKLINLIDRKIYWEELLEGQAFNKILDEVYNRFVLGHYRSMLKINGDIYLNTETLYSINQVHITYTVLLKKY